MGPSLLFVAAPPVWPPRRTLVRCINQSVEPLILNWQSYFKGANGVL